MMADDEDDTSAEPAGRGDNGPISREGGGMDDQPALDFSAGDDRVRLIIQSNQPWTEWEIPTMVVADAGLFHGKMTTSVGLANLETLYDLLASLSQGVGQPHHARWQPTASLSLSFDLSRIGRVTVGVELEEWETGTILKFSLGADQTYLPLWISQVKRVQQHFLTTLGHMSSP